MLPSWVPDYSQEVGHVATVPHFRQQVLLYDACGGRRASVTHIEENILILEGCLIGTVREGAMRMMSLLLQFQAPKWDVFLDWLAFADERLPNGTTEWRDDFWRTLCGDCIAGENTGIDVKGWPSNDFRRLSNDDEPSFDVWCKFNLLDKLRVHEPLQEHGSQNVSREETARKVGSIGEAIRTSTSGRKFIVTEEGHMGLAPSHTALSYQKPDEIMVIPGGKTPFVLKPVGARHIPGLGMRLAHEMIGECYLHGFMDGQGMVDFENKKQVIYLV
jgi:hypothetical protein